MAECSERDIESGTNKARGEISCIRTATAVNRSYSYLILLLATGNNLPCLIVIQSIMLYQNG